MCFIGVLIHKLKNYHSNQQIIYVFIKIAPSKMTLSKVAPSKDSVKNCSFKKQDYYDTLSLIYSLP